MVVASPAVCPRCGSVLVADGDRESVGQCLSHGSVYVPMVSMEVARGENEREEGKLRRKLAGHRVEFRDGCHVAPRCLECPLERCVFDSKEVGPMDEEKPAVVVFDSRQMGEQCVRGMRAIALRVKRLDDERASLVVEARKLAKVAELCEVPLPEEVAGLVGKSAKVRQSATGKSNRWVCPKCGHETVSRWVRRHREEECPLRDAA